MSQEQTAVPTSSPNAGAPRWQRDGTLYVIGVDGMSLDVVEALGPDQLPRFAQLAAEGCHGRLRTISPTNSSLLWTTIATGRHHEDHGIDDFWYYRLGKRRLPYTAVRKGPRWRKKLIRALSKVGLTPLCFFDSRDVRTKTFWDIVAEGGGRVGVVNWWHTWPARPGCCGRR